MKLIAISMIALFVAGCGLKDTGTSIAQCQVQVIQIYPDTQPSIPQRLTKDTKAADLFALCMRGNGYQFSDKNTNCLVADLADSECWKPVGLVRGLWWEGKMNLKKANNQFR